MFWFVPLFAQLLVAPDARSMQAVRRLFDAPAGRNTLTCQITALSPRLGFSLHHWSGFNLSLPLNQFPAAKTNMEIGLAVQITPKGGEPVYLGERLTVGTPPKGSRSPRSAAMSYTGGFYAGPGEYRVRFHAGDNRRHSCQKAWTIKVSPSTSIPKLEPGQIRAVADERWRGLASDGPPSRVTVILEAAPLSPRLNMVRLSSYDRNVLLNSLTTVLDQTKATEATVIAVDPRNRKVIFSTDQFSARQFSRLGRALAGVNFGLVSLETLRGPSETEFMENVLSAAQEAAAKSATVVFLGPVWGWHGKLTPKMRELAGALPRPHFLGITMIPGAPDNLVAQVVRSANGTVRQLVTPDDLAKALEKMATAK